MATQSSASDGELVATDDTVEPLAAEPDVRRVELTRGYDGALIVHSVS